MVRCQVYRGGQDFAPLIFFPADAGSRRAFPRGGNVRRETKALCLVAIFAIQSKRKAERIEFSECGYFVWSPALVKMQKSELKSKGSGTNVCVFVGFNLS